MQCLDQIPTEKRVYYFIHSERKVPTLLFYQLRNEFESHENIQIEVFVSLKDLLDDKYRSSTMVIDELCMDQREADNFNEFINKLYNQASKFWLVIRTHEENDLIEFEESIPDCIKYIKLHLSLRNSREIAQIVASAKFSAISLSNCSNRSLCTPTHLPAGPEWV